MHFVSPQQHPLALMAPAVSAKQTQNVFGFQTLNASKPDVAPARLPANAMINQLRFASRRLGVEDA